MGDKFKIQDSSGTSQARRSLMEELEALVNLGIRERGTVGTRAELLSVMLPRGALAPQQMPVLLPLQEIVPKMTAIAEEQIELGALPVSSEQFSTQRLPDSVLTLSKDTPVEVDVAVKEQHGQTVTALREKLVAQNLVKALTRQQQGIPLTKLPDSSPVVVEDHAQSKEGALFPTKGRAHPHKRRAKTAKHRTTEERTVVVSPSVPILQDQLTQEEGTPPILSQEQMQSLPLIDVETVTSILDSTAAETHGEDDKLKAHDHHIPMPLDGSDEATTQGSPNLSMLPPLSLPLVSKEREGEDQMLEATVELSKKTAAAEELLRIIQRPAETLPDSRLTDTLVETLQEVDQLEEARRKTMASEAVAHGSTSSILEDLQVKSVVTRTDQVDLGQLPEVLSEVGTSLLIDEIDGGQKEILESFAIAKRSAEQLEKSLQDIPPLARLAALIKAAEQYETLVVDESIAPERQQDIRIFYNQLLTSGVSQEQSLEIGLPAIEGTIPKLLASIQTAIELFEKNGFFRDIRNMPAVLRAIKDEKKRSKGLDMSNQDTKDFYRALLREMRDLLKAEAEQAELQYRQFRQQHETASPRERLKKHVELRSQLHPKDTWPQPMLSQFQAAKVRFKMVTGGELYRGDPPQETLGVNLGGLPASSLHSSMVIF